MSTPRSDELLFAAGGDVWEKYGTFVRRTLPEEERGTFSRSSDATFHDRSGNLRTAESGVLRPHWVSSEDSYSARLEAARTNELHNSESPATQTRNLTAGTYTLWMEGSGSVDASGATDGSYGTATESTTDENDLTFTVSAQQDVTFTVNNTVNRFQCEEGSFRSSFIATQGSAVSRAVDELWVTGAPSPQEMSIYVKWLYRPDTSKHVVHIGDHTNGVDDPRLGIRQQDGGKVDAFIDDGTGAAITNDAITNAAFGDVVEVVARLKSDGNLDLLGSLKGGSVNSVSEVNASMPSAWAEPEVILSGDASSFRASADIISGPIIAPGVRTMDEMRSVEV